MRFAWFLLIIIEQLRPQSNRTDMWKGWQTGPTEIRTNSTNVDPFHFFRIHKSWERHRLNSVKLRAIHKLYIMHSTLQWLHSSLARCSMSRKMQQISLSKRYIYIFFCACRLHRIAVFSCLSVKASRDYFIQGFWRLFIFLWHGKPNRRSLAILHRLLPLYRKNISQHRIQGQVLGSKRKVKQEKKINYPRSLIQCCANISIKEPLLASTI